MEQTKWKVACHNEQDLCYFVADIINSSLYCSSDASTGIRGQLTFLSALNTFLSITAFLENVLILGALRKESSLHPPSKLLLCSLATTILFTGLCSGPVFAALLATAFNEHWDICRCVAAALSVTACSLFSVSLLTMSAISVDRLLALLLGVRYSKIQTRDTEASLPDDNYLLRCVHRLFSNDALLESPKIVSGYIMLINLLCLLISIFCYTNVFFTLRHHQNEGHEHVEQPNQAQHLNIARYRKAVISSLWLMFTLLVCYLPHICRHLSFFMLTNLFLSIGLIQAL